MANFIVFLLSKQNKNSDYYTQLSQLQAKRVSVQVPDGFPGSLRTLRMQHFPV
jgi:hypothetical protein